MRNKVLVLQRRKPSDQELGEEGALCCIHVYLADLRVGGKFHRLLPFYPNGHRFFCIDVSFNVCS